MQGQVWSYKIIMNGRSKRLPGKISQNQHMAKIKFFKKIREVIVFCSEIEMQYFMEYWKNIKKHTIFIYNIFFF